MTGVTKATVEGAIHSLNSKAEQLAMVRQFSIRWGSSTMGVSHVLEESDPALSHPTETKIGKTVKEVYDYVLAMNHALQSAVMDRQHRRERTVVGIDPGRTVGIAVHDPDARSVRRAGEE